MNIVIFGTGDYYRRFRRFIDMSTVSAIVDNNPSKWGMLIDGIMINNPNDINYEDVTYVFLLVKNKEPIVKQLVGKGISIGKIKGYKDLASVYGMESYIISGANKVSFEAWKHRNAKRKKFFILSNGMVRSGVPIAMMNLCCVLERLGYSTVYGALDEGNLDEELRFNRIDYIKNIALYAKDKALQEFLVSFDCLIFGSAAVSEEGSIFSELGVPVIWWLHESLQRIYADNPLPMKSNIHYYGGGQRVIKMFHEYYPNAEIEQWMYSIPCVLTQKREIGHIVKFVSIGWFCERKGQDVLLRAIQRISDKKRNHARFIFVCPKLEDNSEWLKTANSISQIEILGEQTQEELERTLSNIDVLVCPSRDDPMPIVVTEAMQHYVPCIVSNQVGQSEFMAGDVGGFVFESEDVEELSRLIELCIDCPKEIEKRQDEAYKIYCNNFSQDAMERKVREIIDKVLN